MGDIINYTSFSDVYNSFFGKITDDMYMEYTEEDTAKMAQDLLLTAVHKFEFPRRPLDYTLNHHTEEDADGNEYEVGAFRAKLSEEEINILATYMIVEWIGQQLASIENTRMKYSGSDFKFTSQANHMQKLLQMKKDYEREGFHLQRLYKRRLKDINGVFHSTMTKIMAPMMPWPKEVGPYPGYDDDDNPYWSEFDNWGDGDGVNWIDVEEGHPQNGY